MTSRNRHFFWAAVLVLLGIALFIGLFYGIRTLTYEGGEDADENFLSFAVGLGVFICCSVMGAAVFTRGLTREEG